MSERIAAKKSTAKGKVTVVGIGPGSIDHVTNRAMVEIRSADSIVGFGFYIQQIRKVIPTKHKNLFFRYGS